MSDRLRRQGQAGNSLIEFALGFALLMPLYVWMVVYGLDLKWLMQVGQVSRDAGHMYARGVDFSLAGNQDVLVRLATGMRMTRTGGSGVVILTRVLKVGPQECTDGGITVSSCSNLGQAVITQRLLVGNSSLKPSRIGTPPPALLQPDGTITPANYLTAAQARATNFGTVLNLADGETAYVAEAWFESPAKDFPKANSREPIYARTIF